MTTESHKLEPTSCEKVGEIVGIYQRGQTWYANFQHAGKQHRTSLKTRSKKEARSRAIKLEAALSEGRFQQVPRNIPISQVTSQYLASVRSKKRAPKTISKYAKVMERVLELSHENKAKAIADIGFSFIDAYRISRAKADPETIHDELVIIRQLVNFALTRKIIVNDPLNGLKLEKPKPSPQPCWSRLEVDRILAATKPPQKAALVLLAETGMRIGELKWLTWADVDLEQGLFHIRPKDNWAPKTGNQRVIPISSTARALLATMPCLHRWVVTASPSAKYPKGDHQVSERRLLDYLQRILEKLQLPGHLHTFRHSFISHAATNGVAESVIRQWVGQVDPEILKLYIHIRDEASQAAMRRLNETTPEALANKEVPPSTNS